MKPLERAILWAPRAVCILFILVLSLFALDIFDEGREMWGTVGALLIHLAPAYVLIALLGLAWRRPWVGAVGSAVLGFLFLRWFQQFLLSAPLFLMAILFLASWLQRRKQPVH